MNHLIKKSPVEQLRGAKERGDLAKILEFPHNYLTYVLFHLKEPRYRTDTIPKKNGGTRELLIPNSRLKVVQKRLSNLLYEYINHLEILNRRKPILKQAHGYAKNKSIHSNAWLHKNKKYVLNFDIENFFGSINFGRVRGFFIENINFKLNENIATVIAQICCHENQLPQGSPCSPIVSNLIGCYLDGKLVSLCKKYNCVYSRYVDDITISTNNDILPSEFTELNTSSKKYLIRNEIKYVVEKCGFTINDSKTRLSFHDARQTVTGLVLSREKINTRKEYYKYARAMLNSLITKGDFVFPTAIKPIDIPDNINKNNIALIENQKKKNISKKILKLEGILKHIYFSRNYKYRQYLPKKTFIKSSSKKLIPPTNKLISIHDKKEINKDDKSRISPSTNYHHWASEQKILWKFLIFKNFISLNRPLLICEGSSDVTYLKHAVKFYCKKNSDKYKILGEYKISEEDNQEIFQSNIGFYRYYSKESQKRLMSSNRILGLTGGLSSMRNFIILYLDFFELYNRFTPKHPIILITDNDDTNQLKKKNNTKSNDEKFIETSYSVFRECKERSIKETDYNTKHKNFYHVKHNLYLVRLPQTYRRRKIKEIEDLLQEKIRNIPYNNKVFKTGPRTPEYKSFLAKYVSNNLNEVNLAPFKNLLGKFIEVISDYTKRAGSVKKGNKASTIN